MKAASIQRALISVHDKTGVVSLARGLHELGVEIVSTGGTARALAAEGVPVREVRDLTGFPEMLDGRVKTLHPKVHGGLLALRDNPDHGRQTREHGIELIDLVAVNLYPFEETLRAQPDDVAAIIEMIDIGGPAMIRSASKNFRHVTVLTSPLDYDTVLSELRETGDVAAATRRRLAARAFAHTAAYDALIADYLRRLSQDEGWPDLLPLAFRKVTDLRYGENPHQSAALYADPTENAPSAATAAQLQGKDLSFNNLLDLDAAFRLVCDFTAPACAIIKHTNPAGAALGDDAADAYVRALAADPVSAFGGIVAFNRPVTEKAAREIASLFLEAVIAPDYLPEALEILKSKKNLRLMRTGGAPRTVPGRDYKRIVSGLLAQDRDVAPVAEAGHATHTVVTRRRPSLTEIDSLLFAWTVARHVKSNAIVYVKGTVTAGVGAGQMSRVDAVRLGASKATTSLAGSVLASDAFFPFRDGVDEAARAGVTAIIQPGGSVKDPEVIAAADEHGIAMVFTGRRHFRH